MKAPSPGLARHLRIIHFLLPAVVLLTLAACHSFYNGRQGQSSSVTDFLFPKAVQLEEERLPHLNLPIRAGIAFVPPPTSHGHGGHPPATSQVELSDAVAAAFRDLPFVESISVIPPSYMRRQGSFDNLDQIRRMLGIDVIVLLGYDQVQVFDSSFASLAVWTIAGAFIIPSERTGTYTLMEAVVYDISTRSLLFRAAGSSEREDRLSTAVGQDRRVRVEGERGFTEATEDLISNLQASLTHFETRVRERPDDFVVTRRPGYRGSGSGGALVLFLGAVLALWLPYRWMRTIPSSQM